MFHTWWLLFPILRVMIIYRNIIPDIFLTLNITYNLSFDYICFLYARISSSVKFLPAWELYLKINFVIILINKKRNLNWNKTMKRNCVFWMMSYFITLKYRTFFKNLITLFIKAFYFRQGTLSRNFARQSYFHIQYHRLINYFSILIILSCNKEECELLQHFTRNNFICEWILLWRLIFYFLVF